VNNYYRELAWGLQELVERRHPRGVLTPMQVLRLRQLKVGEEALEAVMALATPKEINPSLDRASDALRSYFRERSWLAHPWVSQKPSDTALAEFKSELADVLITVILTAVLVEEVTDEPFDLFQAAMDKAIADTLREKVQ
jgi:NTP pyrophosphatase (non-canonical NTP hydrolase)